MGVKLYIESESSNFATCSATEHQCSVTEHGCSVTEHPCSATEHWVLLQNTAVVACSVTEQASKLANCLYLRVF